MPMLKIEKPEYNDDFRPTFSLSDDELYRLDPIPEAPKGTCSKETIITKDAFIKCFRKWILNNDENEKESDACTRCHEHSKYDERELKDQEEVKDVNCGDCQYASEIFDDVICKNCHEYSKFVPADDKDGIVAIKTVENKDDTSDDEMKKMCPKCGRSFRFYRIRHDDIDAKMQEGEYSFCPYCGSEMKPTSKTEEESEEYILPCPFCGKEPTVITSGSNTFYSIRCIDADHSAKTNWFPTKAQAIKEWNNREYRE